MTNMGARGDDSGSCRGGFQTRPRAHCETERFLDNQSKRIYLTRMSVKLRKIEVDTETADLLEARAAALGMSVAALLAEIAANEIILPPDLTEMRAKGE
jgi:hypothetical protein